MQKKITYKNINIDEVIEKEYPEFLKSKYYDSEHKEWQSTYVEDWGLFVNEEFKLGNQELAKKALKFANDVINNSGNNVDLKNILYIGLFEKIVETRQGIHLAIDNLSGEALSLFGMCLQNFSPIE